MLIRPKGATQRFPIRPNPDLRLPDREKFLTALTWRSGIYIFSSRCQFDMFLDRWRKIVISVTEIAIDQIYQFVQLLYILQNTNAVSQYITDPRYCTLDGPTYCGVIDLKKLPYLTHRQLLGIIQIKADCLMRSQG